MTYSLKHIRDSGGKGKLVQMPLSDWKKIEKKLQEAEFLLKLRKDISNSLDEIAEYKQGKKKLKTLREVLAEM
jgi:hypothetical protein